MCRWFAYVSSSEECLLEDVLITPAHSLSKQVHSHYLPKLLSHDPGNQTTAAEITARNRLFNVDGFGLAYYTPTFSSFSTSTFAPVNFPTLYKAAQPPLHDINFRSLCTNTSTLTLFAHIRAATSTPVTSVNNHPFVFVRHTIMHNGAISSFLSISRALVQRLDADAYANIAGSTDSEHFAALYMTYLTQAEGSGRAHWQKAYTTSQMKSALQKALETIVTLQQAALGPPAEPNNLNVAVTDGERMVAMRVRNHATEQPPSLYWSTTQGVVLNRKFPDHPDGMENPLAHKRTEQHGRHVIVASEPSTYDQKEWAVIEKNCALLVEKDSGTRVERMEIPESWNAVAN